MEYRSLGDEARLAFIELAKQAERQALLEEELYENMSPLLGIFAQAHLSVSVHLSVDIRKYWINSFNEGNLTTELLISSFLEYSRLNNYHFIDDIISTFETDSYFEDHIPHIIDAFNAHKQGLYSLSIPCLLITVEGIARKNKTTTTGGKDAIKDTIITLFKESNSYFAYNNIYKDHIIALLVKYIYERTNKLHDKGHLFLNRHAILHGTAIGYATEINSLRAFLLLESICKPLRKLLEELSAIKKS